MKKIIKLSFVLCIFWVANLFAFQQNNKQYKMEDIGTLQSDESVPCSINDIGHICGIFKIKSESFVFLFSDKCISILDLPLGCIPVKLNNLGQIAGNYTDEEGNVRGFLWSPEIGFTDLSTLGGANIFVTDMNDLGQIVGYSETSKTSLVDPEKKEIHAFIWENCQIKDLGALTGDLGIPGDYSIATSINNNSQIIGHSNYVCLHKGKYCPSQVQAVKWTQYKIQKIFPNQPIDKASYAHSFMNHRIIVQTSDLKSYFVDYDTLSYKEIEYHIRTTGRNEFVSGNKGSNSGQIIQQNSVIVFADDRGGYQRINLTTPSNIICNNKEISQLLEVVDINNRGDIVGVARTVFGELHVVILTSSK